MGWLSAIGAGGQQGLDRYSQWRQLDQENQWKELERQRKEKLDEQARLDSELQRKATQQAILKGEVDLFSEQTPVGAKLLPEQVKWLEERGQSHLYDPTAGVYTGTFSQRTAADKAKRDTELYGLQKQEYESKLAEMTRTKAAQDALDQWSKANPKAGARQILEQSARLGVSELPPALKAIVDMEQQRSIVGMQTQAQIEAARMKAKLDEDAATKQRAQLLREQYRTAPKTFAELLRENQQKLYEKGETPTPQQQVGSMYEWLGIRPQLANIEQELKLPGSGAALPGGSPYFQSQVQSMPNAIQAVLTGEATPEDIMAKINNNPQLSGQEKVDLRNIVREFLNPLGFQPPVYTGNEAQTAPPLAQAIRPTASPIRSAVGNGR